MIQENKKLRLVLSMVVLTTMIGCRQDYADPEAFIEKYGNGILMNVMSKDMKAFDFDRLEFSNSEIRIDPFNGEYVKANLTIVPKRGVKYYQRLIPSVDVRGILMVRLPYKLSESVSKENASRLGALETSALLGEMSPVFYSKKSIDAKKALSNVCSVRIYRAKDGAGIFRPVGEKDALAFYDTNDKYKQSNAGCEYYGWLSIGEIRRRGVLCESDPAKKNVVREYVESLTRVNKVMEEIVEVNTALDALSLRYGKDGEYSWITQKVQRESDKIEKEIQVLKKSAESELAKKKRELQTAFDYATREGREVLSNIRYSIEKLKRERNNLQQKIALCGGDVLEKERALDYAQKTLDDMVRKHNISIIYSITRFR